MLNTSDLTIEFSWVDGAGHSHQGAGQLCGIEPPGHLFLSVILPPHTEPLTVEIRLDDNDRAQLRNSARENLDEVRRQLSLLEDSASVTPSPQQQRLRETVALLEDLARL